ncbi:MAG: peptidoglycan-binding protein [Azoarcus sp.]|jgi:type VI secretion system secreted protein VgrG|nr:peptidoglycan-binding protein [Azoarcus sp.]
MKYDESGTLKGVPYRVEFGNESHVGKVGEGGIIDVKRPWNAKTAKVIVYAFGKENQGIEWFINLDHKMENYMTPKGIQSRLKNLGFYPREINGVLGLETEAAVRRFKEAQKVPASSNVDNRLRVMLLNQHGF